MENTVTEATSPRVSVIMCSGGSRPQSLRNTLYSWSKVDYSDVEFIFVNTDVDNIIASNVAREFNFIDIIVDIKLSKSENWAKVSQLWTRFGKLSSGDYVIFAMADEIVSPGVVDIFVTAPTKYRSSLMTYFLSPNQTKLLDTVDWKSDVSLLETLPEFWTYKEVLGAEHRANSEIREAENIDIWSHVTGAPREYWEYIDWFRMDNNGYFWLDSDVFKRELVLETPCHQINYGCCYHQYHKFLELSKADRDYGGYIYKNKEQARLLEPALREVKEDKNGK